MFQEGNQSLGKPSFQISNSGCQGCSVCLQLSLLSCPALTAEEIHYSHLVPGYLVRYCVWSLWVFWKRKCWLWSQWNMLGDRARLWGRWDLILLAACIYLSIFISMCLFLSRAPKTRSDRFHEKRVVLLFLLHKLKVPFGKGAGQILMFSTGFTC